MDDTNSYAFKALSLNVRGLNNQKKRRTIFRWVKSMKIDICFLQETYGTDEVKHIWSNEWGGKIFFSNGTNHARGVAILIKPGSDIDATEIYKDNIGRILLLKAIIQGTAFNLLNIYAPNAEDAQIGFYRSLKQLLSAKINYDEKLLMVGDLNVIFEMNLDRKGGNNTQTKKQKDILNIIWSIINQCDLNDVWRTKNPHRRRYTWRQPTPPIHSRLDLWLISNSLFDSVEEVDIIPSRRSDYSAIILNLNSCPLQPKGRGYWRLNNSFLNEDKYIKGISENLPTWLHECADLTDQRFFNTLWKGKG